MTGALFLILVPLTAAVLTYFIDGRTKTARIILILTAVFHSIMTAGVIFCPLSVPMTAVGWGSMIWV